MLLRESCRRNEGLSDDICFVLNKQKFISTYISIKLKSKKLSLLKITEKKLIICLLTFTFYNSFNSTRHAINLFQAVLLSKFIPLYIDPLF